MHYSEYKTILSPKNGINLYRGCTHGCIYCDSRSLCYQIDHDFEDIEIKYNAPAILEAQLKQKKKRCMIATGSMCDPYMPLEKDLAVTRQCLSLIEKYGFGLSILTKSSLILRDLEILKSINGKTKCVVQTTLTTFDEVLCKKIEPNVSSTKERFHILETMRNADIPTIVWLCPILPFINDTEENLLGLLDYCIKSKVKGILCFGFGVTLRSGSREHFYKNLDKQFPGYKQKYIETFEKMYECLSANNSSLMKIFRETCKRHNILFKQDEIFSYLNTFEEKKMQLSLFQE